MEAAIMAVQNFPLKIQSKVKKIKNPNHLSKWDMKMLILFQNCKIKCMHHPHIPIQLFQALKSLKKSIKIQIMIFEKSKMDFNRYLSIKSLNSKI